MNRVDTHGAGSGDGAGDGGYCQEKKGTSEKCEGVGGRDAEQQSAG